MNTICEVEIHDGAARNIPCLAEWRVDIKGLGRWIKANPTGSIFVFFDPSHPIPNKRLQRLQALSKRGQIRLFRVRDRPSASEAEDMMRGIVDPEAKPKPEDVLEDEKAPAVSE